MTKIGSLELFSNTAGAGGVQTLTGSSGGAVSPDGSSNIDIVGDNTQGITVSGNPGTHTLTVSGIDATTTTPGVVALATNAEAIAGVDTTKAITSDDLGAKLGSQTAHSLLISEGPGAVITALGVATNGQIPIGSTGADPVLGTLTAGANITIMNSPGGITISSAGSGSELTLTGNTGGVVSPDGSSNIDIVGDNTQGITVSGNPGTHTLTVSGIDATTTTPGVVALATNAEAIAGVDTTKAITSDDLGAKLGSQTAHSLLISEGPGAVITALGVATNGQIPIGSTGADPVLGTLTAGANISILNASGSITIGASPMTLATAYTSVSHAASPYTVTATDYYISVDTSGGTVILDFPNTTTPDRLFVIKDRTGTAAINNITITTAGGTVDLDGATSYQIKTDYSAINLLFNGTNYEVY